VAVVDRRMSPANPLRRGARRDEVAGPGEHPPAGALRLVQLGL